MLSNYAPSYLKKKKKKKKGQREQRGRQIYARSGKKTSGLHFVSSIQVWNCERRSFHLAKEMCAKHESWFNKWRIDVAFSSVCTSRRHFGVVVRHPSGGGTSLLEGIFPLNWPIRARLFLLAPRPKSRRHHIRGYKIPLPPPIVGYHSNVQSWRMFLNNTLRHFLCKSAPELEVFWCFHEKCPNWSVLWKCGLDIVCRCTPSK